MKKDFLSQFILDYYQGKKTERMGQMFVNRYIKGTWPELFYEEDNSKSIEMISQWLKDNHYFYKEPPRLDGK